MDDEKNTTGNRRGTDTLSDIAIKKAKPKEKPYRLADGDGLTLLVMPTGGKLWRFRYRYDGVQKDLALGKYPDVPLKAAREKRNTAREKVAAGIDPGAERKEQKAERVNTFEHVAREWHKKHSSEWTPGHANTIIRRLELNIFPPLGNKSIKDITAGQILDALRLVEQRGAIETAHRVKTICAQIFRYAIASGYCENNPVVNLTDALMPVEKKHLASITDPADVGALLRAIDGYKGSHIVNAALKLAPLVFVRPGELRKARWAEIDLESALWNIPAERMKMRLPHVVPLARQSIKILTELKPFTSDSEYVFPSPRTNHRPLSDNAILSALRRMGFEKDEMSGHGFRALARTILDEILKFRPDYIEHQLAHSVKDPNGRAYNRTSHLPERIEMMQSWADYLDKLKSGAKVIPFPNKTGTNG